MPCFLDIAEQIPEGVHAMCNRKGFASNEMTPVFLFGFIFHYYRFGVQGIKV